VVAAVPQESEKLKRVLIDLTGATVSLRGAVSIIAKQPMPALSSKDRKEVDDALKDSLDRIEKVLMLLEELADTL
jgi:hypothetical protein